ncbi:MAG: bifunctional 5,10-methylenetetrahydrofolate dehydrogenase/5,10-methenyltetrahydrofolate cyclohydrolase [Verrucomicrobiae bacterium]|nr:bifunctional 5,10-methylenetetrahydrofolate dehydrogenase/5,10-methenyltetrahydrofolate cyclohydrolase [Verrucomicrobiae bacterium]
MSEAVHVDLDGRRVADELLQALQPEVNALRASGWGPRLVSISIGATDAVAVYVRNQRRAAEKLGIGFEPRDLPATITVEETLAAIAVLNTDPRITGIIIQRPVPAHLPIKQLQRAIHPLKDVEGMHPASIGNIVYNELDLAPCTALASIELLKRTGLKLPGLEVVVIGHSEIVGKPIAFLLMAEGATVTVCHHLTRSVSMHSRRADAVFVAVGKPRLITAEMIKPGAAVIDIGINRVAGPDGQTVTVGDVDYESCRAVAGWITPVPGGVGPVTVAMLMRNTVTAAHRQKTYYEREFSTSTDHPPFVLSRRLN